MSEEWGPWIEHSPGPCPVSVGEYVEVVDASRYSVEEPARGGVVTPAVVACPAWWSPSRFAEWRPIIRYRIRKPKALEQLRKIARDVEIPLVNTPKELVRA